MFTLTLHTSTAEACVRVTRMRDVHNNRAPHPVAAQLREFRLGQFNFRTELFNFFGCSAAQHHVTLDHHKAELFVGFVKILLRLCSCCLRLRPLPHQLIRPRLHSAALSLCERSMSRWASGSGCLRTLLAVKFEQAVVDVAHHFSRKFRVQKTDFTCLANVPIKCNPQAAGGWLSIFGACFFGFLREKEEKKTYQRDAMRWGGSGACGPMREGAP